MKPRFGTIPRLCIILLLVLAVSPLTAPFSTCDPAVLFHDPAPAGSTVLHAKPLSDDPVVGLGGSPVLQYRAASATRGLASFVRLPHSRVLIDLPLRI